MPGQWRQQGFDISQEQTVAVATEFVVPSDWSDRRVFLRFDAVHAGTSYWINGHRLGASENLFTPVEWEITSQVRPGAANRLDLEMKVDTPSERLSYSSGYAFHNLGGIDRRVSIFALPPVHISAMHLNSRLDEGYRDAELELQLAVDNPAARRSRDSPFCWSFTRLTGDLFPSRSLAETCHRSLPVESGATLRVAIHDAERHATMGRRRLSRGLPTP